VTGTVIVRCARCCLRYERYEAREDAACPHCGEAYFGIGRTFDEACADAVLRLRLKGMNDVWRVATHLVYTADVAVRDKPDVNLVHMIRLCPEQTS
jgi:DNA-directed RNA polymerase subunit RPC12/RpoP